MTKSKVNPPAGGQKLKVKSFTLVEVLVTIFIFVLAIGAVTGLIFTLYRTHSYTWQQSLAINEARRGIETMVKEIREAKEGEDGSYPIEMAGDKEFIFYSDIDQDDQIEKVRYFLGTVNSGSQTQECQTSASGGTCSVSFSNFLQGTLISASVKVSVDGDMGQNNREYAEIKADTIKIGEVCRTSCSDCAGTWQGTATYDVTSYSADGFVNFEADATSYVGPGCPNVMKAKFEFSWTEELTGQAHKFKRGVINPLGSPPTYPQDQEIITILTSYVRNVPPIFEYYNEDWPGDIINNPLPTPARLQDTKLMRVYLVINIDPNRPPEEFELESWVLLRNLKEE